MKETLETLKSHLKQWMIDRIKICTNATVIWHQFSVALNIEMRWVVNQSIFGTFSSDDLSLSDWSMTLQIIQKMTARNYAMRTYDASAKRFQNKNVYLKSKVNARGFLKNAMWQRKCFCFPLRSSTCEKIASDVRTQFVTHAHYVSLLFMLSWPQYTLGYNLSYNINFRTMNNLKYFVTIWFYPH